MHCWQMKVTFEEARTHLGMETQLCLWLDLAIVCTTPTLLGSFSWVTVENSLLTNAFFLASSAYYWVLQVFTDFQGMYLHWCVDFLFAALFQRHLKSLIQ